MVQTRDRKKMADERLIVWRRGRAYGDFRSYSDVGGGREALAQPGRSWGTTDPVIANALYDARLAELKAKRQSQAGVPVAPTIGLGQLVEHHLVRKSGGGFSESHLLDLETRLGVAIGYFGASRDPRTIQPDEVRAWADHLAKGGRRKPGTVRHYLNALSGLYKRAQEGLWVPMGYNPVAAMMEKPTGHKRPEAKFFEVPEAALLLEAARVLDSNPRKNSTPGFHAIVATFLLTGGRKSEVLGLEVGDIDLDRAIVRFRPNQHRGLKTQTSVRDVPLWPQLLDILRDWTTRRGSRDGISLLFPSHTGAPLGNLRKSLDLVGEMCGIESGEVRTRAFRHTYCSARLNTVQRILKPGCRPTDADAWDWVEVSRDTVAREMGHGGIKLVDRIYGHRQSLPFRSEQVEYRVDRHPSELGERLQHLKVPDSSVR